VDRALLALTADADGEAPAYICGESFGGPIALTLARRYPSRVRGLILVSTFARYPGRLVGELGLAAWRLVGNTASRHLLRMCHPFTLLGAMGVRFPLRLATAYLRRPAVDAEAYRAKCELAVHFDARRWLSDIRQRAVVLAGTWDPIVPSSSARGLAQMLPDATFYSISGGHLAWCVRGPEVGSLLAGWANERR